MKNTGQALVEYVLIIGLVSVLAISLVGIFGGAIKDKITESSCALVGEEFVKGASRGEGYCVAKED